MSYASYAELTPDLWQRWRRRIAREQRAGTWLITVDRAAIAAVLRRSVARLRCPITLVEGDIVAFEFLPHGY